MSTPSSAAASGGGSATKTADAASLAQPAIQSEGKNAATAAAAASACAWPVQVGAWTAEEPGISGVWQVVGGWNVRSQVSYASNGITNETRHTVRIADGELKESSNAVDKAKELAHSKLQRQFEAMNDILKQQVHPKVLRQIRIVAFC